MSSSEDNVDISDPLNKKRKRNTESYKRNVIKSSKVQGKEHINWKGKTVKARTTGEDCKCKYKCFGKFEEGELPEILTHFNNLDSKDTQDVYLQSLIESRGIVRRRKTNEIEDHDMAFKKPKNHSYLYNVKVNGQCTPVCKKAFIALYGLTRKRVDRLCSLLAQGKSPKDLRGKAHSGNAIPGLVCKKVHDFISALDVKETHYSSKMMKYVDARLTIKILYSTFLSQNPDVKISYDFFRKYYNDNFGYRFGRPQVDVCVTCEELGQKLKNPMLSDSSKRTFAGELIVHKRRAKKFYNTIKDVQGKLKDKNSNFSEENMVIAIDFMQNLQLPNIPVQDIFYLRQLWVFTFCVHNMGTGKADMYVYHEGVAKKSPNEVCSFLMHYIKQNKTDKTKNLIIFGDGRGGQNKNHSVIRVLLALTDLNIFQKVSLYFPVRGHSFLPHDRDFGQVKRVIRKADRIYTVEQYGEMMLKSSSSQKFNIVYVTSEMVINFKSWWCKFYKRQCLSIRSYGRNVPKNEKVTFQISKFRQFNFESDTKGQVLARTFIDGLQQETFSLMKSVEDICLPTDLAYNGKIAIDEKKMEDLKKVLKYIPEGYTFYQDIIQWPTVPKTAQQQTEANSEED